MNIEWQEGAVCYAGGRFWSVTKSYDNSLVDCDGVVVRVKYLIECPDFKLNEPLIGDYIPKSELDTEQKYNDAVEEFGLFGFKFGFDATDTYRDFIKNAGAIKGCELNYLSVCDDGLFHTDATRAKRKLTYSQLMAIGKLKRLINERDDALIDAVENTSILSDALNGSTSKSPMNKRTSTSKVNRDVERVVEVDSTPLNATFKISANKYEREISDRQGNSAIVDVYDVLKAFEVTCPATQHAVKKLLCSGIRGHKDLSTDLIEAKESIVRAIELNG